MKSIAVLLCVLLFSLAAASAQAGDALEGLAGEWVVETFDGEPPEGIEMHITFVDDATVRTVYIVNGETVVDEEMRYEADEDGAITTYPPSVPDGEAGTWEVTDDGKLRLEFKGSGIDGIVMVLGRA